MIKNGTDVIIFLLLIEFIVPIVFAAWSFVKYAAKRQKGRIVYAAALLAVVVLDYAILFSGAKFLHVDLTVFVSSFASHWFTVSLIFRLALISTVFSLFSVFSVFAVRFFHNKRFSNTALSGRRRVFALLLIVFLAVPGIIGGYLGSTAYRALGIVEVCRETEIEENDIISYIDFYNSSSLVNQQDILYLSDDWEYPQRVRIENISVKANGYYRFSLPAENGLGINEREASVLFLSDRYGNLIDSVTVPALADEAAYSKRTGEWMLMRADAEESKYVPAPRFSVPGGFYDDAFELTLSADPGLTIYYTLDCSDPDIDSIRYEDAIHIYDRSPEPDQIRSRKDMTVWSSRMVNTDIPAEKAMVVRAVAVDGKGNASDPVAATYFVGASEYRDETVVSLVSDPYNLFDADSGICVNGSTLENWFESVGNDASQMTETNALKYANYAQNGIEWEREAVFQMFSNGGEVYSAPVGLRVQGRNSRIYTLKPFSIYSRGQYSGTDYFEYPFFEGRKTHSLVLKSNQSYILCQALAESRSVESIRFTPAAVFLNGEYWYSAGVFEKFDEKNLAEKYGLSPENVILVKNGEFTNDADKQMFNRDYNFVKTVQGTPNEIYTQINERFDLQSYADACCFEIFVANMDYKELFNNVFWRQITEEPGKTDTRWKSGLLDMDLNWQAVTNEGIRQSKEYYRINPFVETSSWCKPITLWPIFSKLRTTDEFCKQFVLTFMDMVNTNLSVANTTAVMDQLNITDETIRTFFEKRPEYVIPMVAEEFELKGTVESVTLRSNDPSAAIRLNTIRPVLEDGKWCGEYFTDYPIRLSVDDARFLRWEVTADGKTTVYPENEMEIVVTEGGITIDAIFE